jgi:hypothetical protein
MTDERLAEIEIGVIRKRHGSIVMTKEDFDELTCAILRQRREIELLRAVVKTTAEREAMEERWSNHPEPLCTEEQMTNAGYAWEAAVAALEAFDAEN